MSSSSNTDRERVKQFLAERNIRYMVTVHPKDWCEILVEGSRTGRPKHRVELKFGPGGDFMGCITGGWRVPIFYPRLLLLLLGFGR